MQPLALFLPPVALACSHDSAEPSFSTHRLPCGIELHAAGRIGVGTDDADDDERAKGIIGVGVWREGGHDVVFFGTVGHLENVCVVHC